MEYYSATTKNEIVPFAETWMDLETVIQSEVSQKEKSKYINAFTWDLKKLSTDSLVYKAETGTQA